MSAWAKRGAKCVCIRTPWSWKSCDPTLPLFTRIRAVYFMRKPKLNGVYRVSALDGERLQLDGFEGQWFKTRNFRPLVTRSQEQDLAIFRPLLDRLPVGEDA